MQESTFQGMYVPCTFKESIKYMAPKPLKTTLKLMQPTSSMNPLRSFPISLLCAALVF